MARWKAVVAEKPSVARDLAACLGAHTRQDGRFEGNGYRVTWAFGHLVELAEPHQIDPSWRAWRWERLPMLPERWPLVVSEGTRAQFEVVRRTINDPEVDEVICATDAGREGELIFRYIYEAAACKKPTRRLWISTLTPAAIRAGFQKLRDGHAFDDLGAAARGRAAADWLVGLNLSRAYTLAGGETLSVGRVQTPTLALLVARELEIRAFVPEDYLEVQAEFRPQGSAELYLGTYFRPRPGASLEEQKRLPADGVEAGAIAARVKASGDGVIESLKEEVRRMPAPALYDLAELQRHANRLYGMSAQQTLDVAQQLYERKKLLSYPRTDSRHLSAEAALALPEIVRLLTPRYAGLLAPGTGTRALGARFIDDAKVGDHHAIIPTTIDPQGVRLTPDEQKIYDLVCRRLLQAWHGDWVTATTTVITAVQEDRFHTSGTRPVEAGWKVLDPVTRSGPTAPLLPSILAQGQAQTVLQVNTQQKTTRPPKRLSEANLLTAMETAGQTLDDRALSRAMQERGLGTPATRASIIETLLHRGFVVRDGKVLAATDRGIALVERVDPRVKSPAMTGEWEAQLRQIERGELALPTFLRAVERYVTEVVGGVAPPAGAAPPPPPTPTPRPERARDPARLLSEVFRHQAFRPHQAEVVAALLAGQDALLVMPTGAGKSLCYQLPGLARGGTTLVVSPLIALMEDQVGKLQALGLRAERIHSGRPRAESREVCKAYLRDELDFLYIAPERLSVPGFPELLARRPPTLVAIDEAHCISHWGHDFRPEYRMLGARLPSLRPAPVVALTATATPQVQADIAQQLGLGAGGRFVHGFRRSNLAIEVVEVPKPDRESVAIRVLGDPARRPAILYAPTRKAAEALARALPAELQAAAYHAGLGAAVRERVQRDFLEGRLQVVVATIAFGMGVDKADVRTVIHLALPASLEAYYQEIGRAGRDGLPSRAILLHSYVDLRQHQFFRERSYPEPALLQKLYALLGATPQPPEALLARSPFDDQGFQPALEKLWIHGGALVAADESVTRGSPDWEPRYSAQRAHHEAQLDAMARFPETPSCRMLQIIHYFGDQADTGTPCGLCDVCDPGAGVVQVSGPASEAEVQALSRILEILRRRGELGSGTLLKEAFGDAGLDRGSFERLLSALASARLVTVRPDEFERDGQVVRFRRVVLSPAGRTIADSALGRVVVKRPVQGAKPSGRKRRAKGAPVVALGANPQLSEALRRWRVGEAKQKRVPPFRIMSDRVLERIAAERPQSEAELLALSGVGPAFLKKYGAKVLAQLRRSVG